jgi:hypothetical protein
MKGDENATSLEGLKPDDPVVIITSGGRMGTGRRLGKVLRVTKTMIVVGIKVVGRASGAVEIRELRFRRSSGWLTNRETWNQQWIEPATPSVIAEIRLEHERRRLVDDLKRRFQPENMSLESLQWIDQVLRELEQTKKGPMPVERTS